MPSLWRARRRARQVRSVRCRRLGLYSGTREDAAPADTPGRAAGQRASSSFSAVRAAAR